MSDKPKRYCIKLSENGGKHYLFISSRGTTTPLKVYAAVSTDLDRHIWLCHQNCEPGQIWRVVDFESGDVVSQVEYKVEQQGGGHVHRPGSKSGAGKAV